MGIQYSPLSRVQVLVRILLPLDYKLSHKQAVVVGQEEEDDDDGWKEKVARKDHLQRHGTCVRLTRYSLSGQL